MFFAYVDETGIDGQSPATVMAGIVVNAERLNRTQVELAKIFDVLESSASGAFKELKSSDLLRGKGVWRHMDNATRVGKIENLCHWVGDRKHGLALSAIDNADVITDKPGAVELKDPWQASAWHIALQLQRCHQKQKGSKGRTILVFDDNKVGVSKITEAIYAPPPWTDTYYERAKRQDRLDCIIDTPFAAQSHLIGLVQVADVYAAIFRRYTELHDYDDVERYPGESRHIDRYVEILTPQLIGKQHRWSARSKSECAQWYVRLAPASLKALG